MRSFLRSFTQHGLSLAFPSMCVLCEADCSGDAADGSAYCAECRSQLSAGSAFSCIRCGAEVGPFANTDSGCRHCQRRKFRFERVTCLGMYEGKLKQQLLRGKSSHSSLVLATLATLLAEKIAKAPQPRSFDLVIPIPQHWSQRLVRRQNTAETVARRIAAALDVPADLHILSRRRLPRSQKRVAVDDRFRNQADTFRVRDGFVLEDKSLLLVDDVLTTGATCSEAARVLRSNGAANCHVAVLARVLEGIS